MLTQPYQKQMIPVDLLWLEWEKAHRLGNELTREEQARAFSEIDRVYFANCCKTGIRLCSL